MITDYDFNRTHSPDDKQIFNLLDEMHFNTRATGKNIRHRNLIKKTFIIKELYLHLG